MRAVFALLWLVGCGNAGSDTLVSELRVMSIVPEAPELHPGDTTTAAVRIFDPLAAGGEVWVWTCSPVDGACLGDPPVPTPIPVGDGQLVATLTTSPYLPATDVPQPLALVWALACAPGLCDAFFDDPTGLADPLARVKTIPIAGTSLAFRGLSFSTLSPPSEVNPTLTGPAAASDGQRLAFTVVGADAGTAYAYTTAGLFDDTSAPVVGGAFTFTWTAPSPVVPADLLVVVDDGSGGEATWETTVTP